jgi:polyhydroxyalkanoate synthesis repressor PhaR
MALIKRYANRKLYHSEAGCYVTLEDIAAMVRKGEDVCVVDHASGRDLTTTVLLQALVEEEKRLGEMLPRVVLTRLLQNGEDTLASLRARMLAAFDPDSHLEEQIRGRIDRLVRRGELAAEEGKRIADILLRQDGDDESPAVPPTSSVAIDALRQQVEGLEQELQRLMENRPHI